MESDTITLPREQYEALKQRAQVDEEIVHEITEGIQEIIEGRITEI